MFPIRSLFCRTSLAHFCAQNAKVCIILQDFFSLFQVPADDSATATLIPVVVGILVAVIILVVIIVFVVRKRRARNNYDAEKAENGKVQAEETQKLNDNHPDA